MNARLALQAGRRKKDLANQLIIGPQKNLSIRAARVQFVFSWAWESTVHEEDPKFKPEVLH